MNTTEGQWMDKVSAVVPDRWRLQIATLVIFLLAIMIGGHFFDIHNAEPNVHHNNETSTGVNPCADENFQRIGANASYKCRVDVITTDPSLFNGSYNVLLPNGPPNGTGDLRFPVREGGW